jgi:hypothetical protein
VYTGSGQEAKPEEHMSTGNTGAGHMWFTPKAQFYASYLRFPFLQKFLLFWLAETALQQETAHFNVV